MSSGLRNFCINPRCNRTFDAEKHPNVGICRKCWNSLPKHLRDDHKRYRKKERQLKRMYEKRGINQPRLYTLERLMRKNWLSIKETFHSEKPEGIDGFMEQIGLRDADPIDF